MTAPPGAPRPREMSDLSLKVRPTVRPISLRRGATALLPRNPVTSAHGEKAQSACCWPKRELRSVLSERWAARSLLWPGLNVNRSDRGPLVCRTLDRRNFKADTGKSSVTEHIARLLLLARRDMLRRGRQRSLLGAKRTLGGPPPQRIMS
jgi:hypothetical protein